MHAWWALSTLPIISATVRPLVNLPLGSPLPKSIPYHGKLAWARLLLRYMLLPTSESESPKMNCTILHSPPSIVTPRTAAATHIAKATSNFISSESNYWCLSRFFGLFWFEISPCRIWFKQMPEWDAKDFVQGVVTTVDNLWVRG